MKMDKEGFKFDLETQRFLINRWETDIGKRVHEKIVAGIKASVEIRAILDDYVLNHPENIDPYGHPIYPKSEMKENSFWVLTQDDLRGIKFYSEDFSSTRSLEKKSLSYSSFHNCDLTNTDLQRTDISYARFEKCKMEGIIFARSGGFNTKIIDSNLKNACLWDSGFIECDFSGSDFSGVYFESALLKDFEVNYHTTFDLKLITKWRTRSMPKDQIPDILNAIRISYGKAELWSQMDNYLYEEKKAQRKYILWERVKNKKSNTNLWSWFFSYLTDLLSGYSTKPVKVIFTSIIVTIFYSLFYFFNGVPSGQHSGMSALLESIYFSFTTFAALGYGDLSYSSVQPIMRLISATEALIGVIFISLFIVVLARKVFR